MGDHYQNLIGFEGDLKGYRKVVRHKKAKGKEHWEVKNFKEERDHLSGVIFN